MADEPSTRVGNIIRRIEQIEQTFASARINVADPEARERFGDDHLKMRALFERRERRWKWLATAAATIIAGVTTALVVSLGPYFARLFGK